MKRNYKKIGYMAIDENIQETNGGGGSSAPIEPTYEQTAEPIDIYPRDPLQEFEEPMPDDVAVQLGQDVPTTEQMPPQLAAQYSAAPPTTEQTIDAGSTTPAPGINWKLVLAIAVVGYFLMKNKS
jgi:hypothetical protein